MDNRFARKLFHNCPVDPKDLDVYRAQLEAFRKKFGREMGPDDPFFFDPTAAEPQFRPPEEADDAPQPDGMDLPGWTARHVRASEDSLAQRHREMRLTVAIDDSASIRAFTELRVSRGSTLGFTDDTGTVATHRQKGLARAVKIESLRRLRADHPEVQIVSASNAEENAVMRHLNESIGFRPTAVVTSAVLDLADP